MLFHRYACGDSHGSGAGGQAYFLRKTIDLDPERIKRTLEAVQKAGVKLQVGFNRRYDHNFKTVKDMVVSGKIGEPHIIKITSRDPAPPPIDLKISGGIFLDMTIHDLDMARYLSGSEVIEVYANADVLVDPRLAPRVTWIRPSYCLNLRTARWA